jgi:peptide deformylase
MAKLVMWNMKCLKTPSRPLTGPLPEMYIRDLTRMVEELQGVYLSGIQVGDARRFAIPNPRFKGFPVLYNPEIVEQYDLIPSEGEGCLSFPGMWVLVPRYKYITIKYRDGQWQEKTATFGAEDQETEEALLAKAIQHEMFHMDGIVTHERMQDVKKRLKVSAKIMKASIEQNRLGRTPKLVDSPTEIDPPVLPVCPASEATVLEPETRYTLGVSGEETVYAPDLVKNDDTV